MTETGTSDSTIIFPDYKDVITSDDTIHRDAHAYESPNYPTTVHAQGSEFKEDESLVFQQSEFDEVLRYQGEKEFVLQKHINTKPLSATAKTYQLEKFKKNAMIIFNHLKVEGYSDRIGTIEDEKVLRETFSKFGFEFEDVRQDLKKVELFQALKKFSEKDFTDYGCVVIVVLTHGTYDGQLRASDEGQLYREQDIISHFKTYYKPSLVTKPVILLIQACRGKASTIGMGVATSQRMRISKDHDEELRPYYLPVESDMLVFHSSYIGKPAFRTENGSWFIQTLCKKINELFLTHDLESIFTEVKREVAVDRDHMIHNYILDQNDYYKQMPIVTSTLIRKLYLRKFQDKPPMLPYFIRPGNCETSADSEQGQVDGEISCGCFLDHFDYMKRCLRYIVQKNPKDTSARCLLNIADSDSGTNDNKTKDTLVLISNHIRNNYKNMEYHKYVYFYDNGFETDADFGPETKLQRFFKTWNELSNNNVMRGLGTCVGAYLIYNFAKR